MACFAHPLWGCCQIMYEPGETDTPPPSSPHPHLCMFLFFFFSFALNKTGFGCFRRLGGGGYRDPRWITIMCRLCMTRSSFDVNIFLPYFCAHISFGNRGAQSILSSGICQRFSVGVVINIRCCFFDKFGCGHGFFDVVVFAGGVQTLVAPQHGKT